MIMEDKLTAEQRVRLEALVRAQMITPVPPSPAEQANYPDDVLRNAEKVYSWLTSGTLPEAGTVTQLKAV